MTLSNEIAVDVRNPGQFFACGGLLILASALDENATGGFTDDERFVIDGKREVLDALASAGVVALGDNRSTPANAERLATLQAMSKARNKTESAEMASLQDGPMALILDERAVRLDWWLEPAMQDAGFKTWSGGQHAFGFLDGMLGHIAAADVDDLFAARPLSSPKPFYFDARVSRLTSLDLGFSPDGFTASLSPAVELLAFVGLQWFRPRMIRRRQSYSFATWRDPLPLEAAAVAATGLAPALCDRHFRFPLVRRTGGKYKAFGPAEPADLASPTHGDIDA